MLVLFIFTVDGQTQSQSKYPGRPISVIVPYSVGGSLDVVIRINAAYLSEKWGVPVNVINKPGGNSIPACLEVMSGAADGYTFLAESSASCSLLTLVKDLPFKVIERTFVCTIAGSPMMLLVPPSKPWRTMADIAEAIKKNPDSFTYSTGGVSVPAIVLRQFFAVMGADVLKMRDVMNKGGGEAVTMVAGGHVNLASLAPASTLSAIKAGIVRPIALTSKERYPALPDVPTTKEAGFPSVDFQLWHGFSGPPNLPVQIVDMWNQTIQRAHKDPKFIARLNNAGMLAVYRNSADTKEWALGEVREIKKLWGMSE